MALAQLIIHSGERRGGNRRQVVADATLRDAQARPIDVTLRNLSTTGCMIETDRELGLDTGVSIGIVGAPVTAATVVRRAGRLYGCRFVTPLSAQSVRAAGYGANVLTLPAASRHADPVDVALPAGDRPAIGAMLDNAAKWAAFLAITPLAVAWIGCRGALLCLKPASRQAGRADRRR